MFNLIVINITGGNINMNSVYFITLVVVFVNENYDYISHKKSLTTR